MKQNRIMEGEEKKKKKKKEKRRKHYKIIRNIPIIYNCLTQSPLGPQQEYLRYVDKKDSPALSAVS